ncbi:helix-turn-helix domain-containing protein [Haematospirillum sp. H1815]|uniref:helix-turn-helix domain-containing protein n=1 Tax=Haematospirillum sp. H1815 TaxID=2723108 RepID=UPI0039F6A934
MVSRACSVDGLSSSDAASGIPNRDSSEEIASVLPSCHGAEERAAVQVEGLAEAVQRSLAAYFAMHKDGLPPAGLYNRLLSEFERPLLTLALDVTGGNQIRAAALLGLNRNTLRKKIRALSISPVRGSV